MVTLATIRLWGQQVGAVSWNADRGVATFAYTPAFVQAGLDVAPLRMPLAAGSSPVYSFPALNESIKKCGAVV
jgi:serine/threonine-protein kinase HipA